MSRCAVVGSALALAALCCLPATALGAVPEWTTYRHDAARSGIDPESTSPVAPSRVWQSAELDGSIYAEPLVHGSDVYVATENDTIYSLEAGTGKIAWERHLGTAVPSNQLPCGDIEPTVGITSTPVIDPATNTLYAVTDTWNGTEQSSIRHRLVALDLSTGAMRPNFPLEVDPPYPSGGSARNQLQRAALALDGNEVVIGYGGNSGDCETYWGWLVGAPESGEGALRHFQVDAGHLQGAIWGSGNGPALNSSGDIYTATGNGSSGSEYDFGDSVLKLNANLELLESWAPADWQQLDESDADLGSSDPVLLPGGYIFQIGKQGVGVLLHANALGGEGTAPVAELSVCGGSWGGGIFVPATAETGTIYVTCSGGVLAVSVNALNTTEPKLTLDSAWTEAPAATGPPIFAGGLVWVASYEGEAGTLFGLSPASGKVEFQENLGGFVHFATPAAGGGRLFVANDTRVTAFVVATVAPTYSTAFAAGGLPTDVAVTSEGDVWVSSWEANTVKEFKESGEPLRAIGALESPCSGKLEGPYGLAVDSAGDLWVTDMLDGFVRKFSAEGKCLLQVALGGRPRGIALDAHGNVWVSGTAAGCLQELSGEGVSERTVGCRLGGTFTFPGGLAIDPHGHIWLADIANSRVIELGEAGEYLGQLGNTTNCSPVLCMPMAVTADANGHILVSSASRIDEFSESGQLLVRFGGFGSSEGQMEFPMGVAIDSKGNLWVADTGNGRAEKWSGG